MAPRKIHDTPSMRVMAYRKRRQEGMKRLEIWLSDAELAQFDQIAAALGCSRARVVAHLLPNAGSLPVEAAPMPAPPARPDPIGMEAQEIPEHGSELPPPEPETAPEMDQPVVATASLPESPDHPLDDSTPAGLPELVESPEAPAVAEILRAAEAAHAGWMPPVLEPPAPP
ncbi:MAG: hypothetical protein HQM01_15670, partial [Magnetococcales bacterium]|nr:hypothetical protein [Magnetococcales bacterium]